MDTSIRNTGPSTWVRTLALGALFASGVAACGGNLTAGGFGEASVSVSGDAPGGGAAADLVGVTAVATDIAAASNRDDPEGELEAEFFLFLIDADGGAISLSDAPLRVEVDVEGEREADATTATVPAARYTGLRIVFTEIEVEVDAGLIVDGVPIVGAVEVELEDAELPVERAIDLQIRDGDQVAMLVDLNTAAWLQAVDPDLRTVAETVFAEAISVVVR